MCEFELKKKLTDPRSAHSGTICTNRITLHIDVYIYMCMYTAIYQPFYDSEKNNSKKGSDTVISLSFT